MDRPLFTPGPWLQVVDLEYDGDSNGEIDGFNVIHTAQIMSCVGDDQIDIAEVTSENDADMSLIIAAPDLYTACEAALEQMDAETAADCRFCGGEGSWTDDPIPRMTPVIHKEGCAIPMLAAALAKARGETP